MIPRWFPKKFYWWGTHLLPRMAIFAKKMLFTQFKLYKEHDHLLPPLPFVSEKVLKRFPWPETLPSQRTVAHYARLTPTIAGEKIQQRTEECRRQCQRCWQPRRGEALSSCPSSSRWELHCRRGCWRGRHREPTSSLHLRGEKFKISGNVSKSWIFSTRNINMSFHLRGRRGRNRSPRERSRHCWRREPLSWPPCRSRTSPFEAPGVSLLLILAKHIVCVFLYLVCTF